MISIYLCIIFYVYEMIRTNTDVKKEIAEIADIREGEHKADITIHQHHDDVILMTVHQSIRAENVAVTNTKVVSQHW